MGVARQAGRPDGLPSSARRPRRRDIGLVELWWNRIGMPLVVDETYRNPETLKAASGLPGAAFENAFSCENGSFGNRP